MKGRKPSPMFHHDQSPISGPPACPRELDAVARKTWRRVTKLLHAANIITKLDLEAVAMFCRLHSEEQQLLALLAAAPNGFLLADETGRLALNPLRRELKVVRDQKVRLAGEIGLTAVSRTRLPVRTTRSNGVPVRDRSEGPPLPKARFFKIEGAGYAS